MATTNDRRIWDLFDKAQSGELQAAEAHVWGLDVNPHYLGHDLIETMPVAEAMKSLPWIQNLHETIGDRYLSTLLLRGSYDQWFEVDSPKSKAFEFALQSLRATGLVNTKTEANKHYDMEVEFTRIGRRAVEADYREVIEPSVPSCLGIIGRFGGALAAGAGATQAGLELLDLDPSGVIGNTGQLFVASTVGLTAIYGMSNAEQTIRAAAIHRQYTKLGY